MVLNGITVRKGLPDKESGAGPGCGHGIGWAGRYGWDSQRRNLGMDQGVGRGLAGLVVLNVITVRKGLPEKESGAGPGGGQRARRAGGA